ncbi:carboxymuconolactone decarboxylase family protein [Actinokineospora sp.]|uniref:carboxymuconolactone decarboxylase family protein n=1 Tax=Actinokineospora sp. TaxID=1872133 RepID=UPI0040380E1F
MPYLKSLPADAVLLQVFRTYPETAKPLIDYHELVMRGSSPFTLAERELIAAYVSGVNACDYCHGVHTATAEAFGVPPGLLAAAVADLDTAPIDDKLKAVLRYVGTLTRTPSRVTAADAQAVFDAGWDEKALHDAVLVCALFNFMNRMVDGLGVRADASYFATSGTRLHDIGYSGLTALIDE